MLRWAKHLLSQQLLADISLRDFDAESVVEDRQLQVSVSLVAPDWRRIQAVEYQPIAFF